jgi:hypothetical protein
VSADVCERIDTMSSGGKYGNGLYTNWGEGVRGW